MLQGVLIRGKEEQEMKECNNTVEREDDLLGKNVHYCYRNSLLNVWPKICTGKDFCFLC